MSALEESLAGFVLGTRDLGSGTAMARRLFLDAIACSFAGRRADARTDFASATRSLAPGSGHGVIGDHREASLVAAAGITAWQTTAMTMCDVYRPTLCHVSPPVLGAVMASVTEAHTIDDILLAFGMGAEVTVRLCDSMNSDAYLGRRWHAPGIIGPFGAATAAAILAGVDETELLASWGLALLQSSGTFSAIGTTAVKFTQARAGMAGVIAVEYAKNGAGGSHDAITHPHGGLHDAYEGGDPELILEDLGTSWSIEDISLRRWAAASSLQSVIEAVLNMRTSNVPDTLEVALPPQSYVLCAERGWESELMALQSAAWIASVAWLDGDCSVDQVGSDRRRDPAAMALARIVRVVEDGALPRGSARVTAAIGGKQTAAFVPVARGSEGRELTDADVADKLARACGERLAQRIETAVDTNDSTALLTALTTDQTRMR